jgi:translation initiation factor 1
LEIFITVGCFPLKTPSKPKNGVFRSKHPTLKKGRIMNKNIFEMGANFEDNWSSDNKTKPKKVKKESLREKSEHRLHFAKEKRRGKVVTIVKPFYMPKSELQIILKELKKSMGVGGTLKDEKMEFQGEIEAKLKENLQRIGFKFKQK